VVDDLEDFLHWWQRVAGDWAEAKSCRAQCSATSRGGSGKRGSYRIFSRMRQSRWQDLTGRGARGLLQLLAGVSSGGNEIQSWSKMTSWCARSNKIVLERLVWSWWKRTCRRKIGRGSRLTRVSRRPLAERRRGGLWFRAA
jgi:hypothetical protein